MKIEKNKLNTIFYIGILIDWSNLQGDIFGNFKIVFIKKTGHWNFININYK